MHYSKIAVAATPVFAAYASALGSAIVKNSCGDAAYFWSCGDTVGEKITIAPGSSHTEGYKSKSGGGGMSLKIASSYRDGPKAGLAPESIYDQPQPQITQFEYTVGSPGPPSNMVWYDISNINGYPFVNGGVKITSSDGSVNVECPKGVQYCKAAYNAPHDDHATGSAPESVNLVMELCSDAPGVMAGGGAGSSGGSSEGSSPPQKDSAKPAPAPASTPESPPPQRPQQPQQQQKPASSPPAGNDGAPVERLAQPVAAPSPTTTEPPAPPPKQEDVVVYVTETAQPVVVTVHAMAEKRDAHVHQHAHNKIHKRRHGN
ncbi:hypothetical protein N7G274_005412 [Stereocaulon virgatum]|uniref:Uncharacterized protein n=1 Tax=Stereocaulon virgatum TaxID=373712 RepID=A0ABR4A970_9LECA